MSIRRIAVLLKKEFKYGSRSYFFIFAIVAPIVFTLFVNLIFGSLFAGKPKLGILDHGDSRIVDSLRNMESIDLEEYESETELKAAVESGARDVGIVLQENFDSLIKNGESTRLTAYIWGESLLKDRAIAGTAVVSKIRDISGKKVPVDIITVSLGNEDAIPWKERFLPTIVLMAIFISGFAVPGTSLVNEKEKRTIGAVLITPVTQYEIFISKGLIGVIVSIMMGILILVLNQAFNAQLGLIILILLLGAILAGCIGLLIGAFMKDIASMYSVIKGLGAILYGPGIVAMFPQIPQWIGKLFPTYYVINPIMEIARKGGSWSTVKLDVFILIGIIAIFFAIVGVIANKTSQQIA